jgi:hypothetical protein
VASACGDGADPGPTATPTATGTAQVVQTAEPGRATITATSNQTGFGPAPTLGGHVNALSPEHGQRIPQAQTRTIDPGNPRGICAEVDFEGLPENVLWFRFALDGREYTTQLVWVVPTDVNPEEGKMCYAPEEGIPVGMHDAAIVVQDPSDTAAATREVVSWRFEVTE